MTHALDGRTFISKTASSRGSDAIGKRSPGKKASLSGEAALALSGEAVLVLEERGDSWHLALASKAHLNHDNQYTQELSYIYSFNVPLSVPGGVFRASERKNLWCH